MKTFLKAKTLVNLILVASLAAMTLTGCSTTKQPQEEIPETVSFSVDITEHRAVQNSVESSDDSIVESDDESSMEVEESSTEESDTSISQDISSTESSSEDISTVESIIDEISEEDSSELQSIEDSSVSELSEDSVAPINVTPYDAIRYGQTTSLTIGESSALTSPYVIPENINICIMQINDETYDVYAFGIYVSVDSSTVELYPSNFVPDFSFGNWFGVEGKYRT